MEKFTILGAGWLGLALAKDLKDTYDIKVSFRNLDKANFFDDLKLKAYFLDENNTENLDILLDTDYLFINFPPSKFSDYLCFLSKIYTNKAFLFIKKVIFISSTSVYDSAQREYFEDSEFFSQSLVYEAEKMIYYKTDIIFRCAGLMGYDRIAGKYFANKVVDNCDDVVNYVHRDDVILATKFVLQNSIDGVFNLCSKQHPTKKEIYMQNYLRYGFEKPIFKKGKIAKNRVINTQKILKLGFEYKFDNPVNYI